MAWSQKRTRPRNNPPIPQTVRRKVFKEYPYCWLAIPGVCTEKSEQIHHLIEDVDGGTNELENLVGVCKPCHTKHSAQQSQIRAMESAWGWKRKPEKHPGVLD